MSQDQPANSTNYEHPRDPNLANIHKAMQYNNTGEPVVRTHVDGITLEGNVIVDKVRVEVDSLHNTIGPNNPVPISGNGNANSNINPIYVNVTNGIGTVNLSQTTLDALETINVNLNAGTNVIGKVDQNGTWTVGLSQTTLDALETTTVNQGTAGSTPWKVDIGTNGTVTANVTFPSIYKISKDTNANTTDNRIFVDVGTPTVTVNQPVAVTQHANSTPWQISKNSAANSATNRIFVSMETDAVLADSNYFFNVARGLVDTHTPVLRSAFIPSTPNSETSVWVEGGLYPYASWTSASILYIASDSAADTSLSIFIEGLDSNYVYQSETVTTNASNGTTTVTTTKQYLRIFKGTIVNNNANSPNAGEIRFRITSASGTVVAHIGAGIGVTKLSQYTIPAGFTGYLLYGDVATFKSGAGNQGCRVKLMVRPYQQSFITAFIALASNGVYRHDFTVPVKITEKSDLDVRVLTDSTGASVSASYEMILIPN